MCPTTTMPQTAREKADQQLKHFIASDHFHPLEAISYFRRWPRSWVRNLIYTLILNLLFAIGFTLLAYIFVRKIGFADFPVLLGENLVISNVVGFAFWMVFAGLGPLMRTIHGRSFWVVTLFYTALGTLIVTVALWGFALATGRTGMAGWIGSREQVFTSTVISLFISLVLAMAWKRRSEELTVQIALAEERERAEASDRSAAQANLRALQAQIEPHFLFNTLANVTSLIHSHPDDAKRMLENFIEYLRATLATTREAHTTVGSEFDMMKKFLSILKIRMGDRLEVHLDLDPELAAATMPPMLLQPLIENAIKHGLEPKLEGGSISMKAERKGDRLCISVIDTGLGFGNKPSNGIGLKNVRERVEKLFGNAGGVSSEENQPCGTRVVVTIPYAA
ncbi:MAG: sensor histidine kinase [Usitatibacteraceae bacterium]